MSKMRSAHGQGIVQGNRVLPIGWVGVAQNTLGATLYFLWDRYPVPLSQGEAVDISRQQEK